MMNKLDQEMPNTFQYQLHRDAGTTGNFECTMYKKADLSDEGSLIYSKKKEGKFPHKTDDQWKVFKDSLDKTINAEGNKVE